MSTTSPDVAAPARPGQIPPRERLALLVITTATLLVTLDSTIVNVAQPTIKEALHFSSASLEWVITAYTVAFGGLLLLGGRLGDLYGRRRMFLIGISVFTLASLAGGLAPTANWLIAARAVQGLGAAIASPAALSLIATTFAEGSTRNKAMGMYAIVAGFGGALGLVVGGLLTHVGSWRWVFFVAVPFGALVLAVAPRVLIGAQPRSGRLDLPGAVLGTAGVALLVYGLVQGTGGHWAASGTLVPLIAAAVLIVAFILVEARATGPLMPLHLFTNRNRCAAYLVTLAVGSGLYGITFFLMLYLQEVLGFDSIRAGLGFLPLAVAIGLLAAVMGRLAARIGTKVGAAAGPLVAGLGAAWLALETTADGSYAALVGPMIVLGAGLGAAIVPLTLTALSAIQPAEAGITSALVTAGQQIGGGVGLAVLGSVAASSARGYLGSHPAGAAAAGAHGYRMAFLVAAVILMVASALATVLIKQARPGRPAAPTEPAAQPAASQA
jgi:EmrB/QacA subfamily drug resistance transporter